MPMLNDLSAWCGASFGEPIEAVLFEAGFSTHVFGIQLRDGRRVVLKLRRFMPRLAGTGVVHRHMRAVGFPCPEPLAPPQPIGAGWWVSAEELVQGGAVLADDAK